MMSPVGLGLTTVCSFAPVYCDIIVIHGLLGSEHSSWTDMNWDDFLPTAISDYGRNRLSIYRYDVFGLNGGILTRNGARSEATKLLDAIMELRKGFEETAIAFVAHDLGGSLLKEALVLAQHQKYKAIYMCLHSLAFLGSPHQGAKFDLQMGCAELLMSHSRTTFAEAWELSGPLVEWVQATNNSFAETRLSSQVTTYAGVSTHPDDKQRVFNKDSTSIVGLGTNSFTLHNAELAHRDLLRHSELMRLLANGISRLYMPRDPAIGRDIAVIVAKAPPRYPLESTSFAESYIRTSFLEFMNIDGPGSWLIDARDLPCCDPTELAHAVVHWATELPPNSLVAGATFDFDAFDDRCNSAEAALSTLVAESCSVTFNAEDDEVNRQHLSSLAVCRKPADGDLWAVYVEHILQALVNDTLPRTLLVVLGNLDGRIKNGAWLFNEINELIQDCDLKLKFVITSSNPTSLTQDGGATAATMEPKPESFSNCSYRMRDAPEPASNPPAATGKNIERSVADSTGMVKPKARTVSTVSPVFPLIQRRPELHSCGLALEALARSCGMDSKLWGLIVNWLLDAQLPRDEGFEDIILHLTPATPVKIFEAILRSIPHEDRSWSSTLLERVLCAFRPLTLSELLDMELVDCTGKCHHGKPGISTMRGATENICGGLLTVQRGEVRLAHPELRDYLWNASSPLGGWFALDSLSSTHRRIATACLNYLSMGSKLEVMVYRAGEGRRHTAYENRQDFISYAVKYWLRHAKLADNAIFTSETCSRFLANDELVSLWATLYQALHPSYAASQDPLPPANVLASLPIFAHYEVEAPLFSLLDRQRTLRTDDLSSACFAAVIEATGTGNTDIARELLKAPLPEESLDELILAAMESGSNDVFNLVLSVQEKHPKRVGQPGRLLARAASLGHVPSVKAILDMPETQEWVLANHNEFQLPLSFACQRGHVKVVEMLFRENKTAADAAMDDLSLTPRPVLGAMQFGRSEVIDVLRHEWASDPEIPTSIRFYVAVFRQARFGRRKPIQAILRYIERKLDADPHDEDSTGTTDIAKDSRFMKYLRKNLLYRDLSDDEEAPFAASQAIGLWPHVLDLIDLLSGPRQALLKDPEFPSYFNMWVTAAVDSQRPPVLELVFKNGAESPWATAEVLEAGATKGLESALMNSVTDLGCIKYLVEKGADIKSQIISYWDRTPLFHAAYRGMVEAAELLIEANADVNAKGNATWFPIHACYDNAEITKQLIAAGADINILTEDDEPLPSLWFSVMYGHPQVVEAILEAKPSKTTLDYGLKAAAERRLSDDMMERFLRYYPDGSSLPATHNLLQACVRTLKPKSLQRLLEDPYRLDPNKRNGEEETALHCITYETSSEMIALLLKAGANAELFDSGGNTPLAIAARQQNTAAAQCLVEHGASVNASDGRNISPFLAACSFGDLEMVRIMHTKAMDPVDVDRRYPNDQWTAINSALLRDNREAGYEITRYLLEECHARVDVPTMYWSGALEIACLRSTPDMIRMLIEKYDADVNVKDNAGRTPLHFALYNTREHVEPLLEHGADLDAVDIINRTALHCAVLSGQLDVVRLVLDKRPGLVDQKDLHEWTPLLWALRMKWSYGNDYWNIIQELLSRGARRLVRGQGIDRTWTPIKTATYYGLNNAYNEVQDHQADLVNLLAPRPEDFEGVSDEDRDWDWKSGGGKRGVKASDESTWCAHCQLSFVGYRYICEAYECGGNLTILCLHCYQSWRRIHAVGHLDWRMAGEEEDIGSITTGSEHGEEMTSSHSMGGHDEVAEGEVPEGVENEDEDNGGSEVDGEGEGKSDE
ncbi:putative ankyrin repeat-containing protein [Echria macrotheca]|uniref:Ankyrin repeat-containing protein n=1 Tax=Echria macrotheca TaxID=438768 RepID=A0AAJ0BES8_9PEZI|nr:putative ankyrin repeat-containing protein [Echria macrotheca]